MITDSLICDVISMTTIFLLSDLELKPVGILEVKLVQASDLTNKDVIGKSDPFAVLYIRPLQDRMKTSKTIVSLQRDFILFNEYFIFLDLTFYSLQNNDLNPIWNEHFEFIVEDATTQNLTVKIYDDEGLQPPEFIGCAQVKLKDLQPGKVKDVWLKLVKDLEVQRDKKDRGQVSLHIIRCYFFFLFCSSFQFMIEEAQEYGQRFYSSNHDKFRQEDSPIILLAFLAIEVHLTDSNFRKSSTWKKSRRRNNKLEYRTVRFISRTVCQGTTLGSYNTYLLPLSCPVLSRPVGSSLGRMC